MSRQTSKRTQSAASRPQSRSASSLDVLPPAPRVGTPAAPPCDAESLETLTLSHCYTAPGSIGAKTNRLDPRAARDLVVSSLNQPGPIELRRTVKTLSSASWQRVVEDDPRMATWAVHARTQLGVRVREEERACRDLAAAIAAKDADGVRVLLDHWGVDCEEKDLPPEGRSGRRFLVTLAEAEQRLQVAIGANDPIRAAIILHTWEWGTRPVTTVARKMVEAWDLVVQKLHVLARKPREKIARTVSKLLDPWPRSEGAAEEPLMVFQMRKLKQQFDDELAEIRRLAEELDGEALEKLVESWSFDKGSISAEASLAARWVDVRSRAQQAYVRRDIQSSVKILEELANFAPSTVQAELNSLLGIVYDESLAKLKAAAAARDGEALGSLLESWSFDRESIAAEVSQHTMWVEVRSRAQQALVRRDEDMARASQEELVGGPLPWAPSPTHKKIEEFLAEVQLEHDIAAALKKGDGEALKAILDSWSGRPCTAYQNAVSECEAWHERRLAAVRASRDRHGPRLAKALAQSGTGWWLLHQDASVNEERLTLRAYEKERDAIVQAATGERFDVGRLHENVAQWTWARDDDAFSQASRSLEIYSSRVDRIKASGAFQDKVVLEPELRIFEHDAALQQSPEVHVARIKMKQIHLNERLFEAVKKGVSIDALKLLLHVSEKDVGYPDVLARDADGNWPLHFAHTTEMAEQLIDADPSPEKFSVCVPNHSGEFALVNLVTGTPEAMRAGTVGKLRACLKRHHLELPLDGESRCLEEAVGLPRDAAAWQRVAAALKAESIEELEKHHQQFEQAAARGEVAESWCTSLLRAFTCNGMDTPVTPQRHVPGTPQGRASIPGTPQGRASIPGTPQGRASIPGTPQGHEAKHLFPGTPQGHETKHLFPGTPQGQEAKHLREVADRVRLALDALGRIWSLTHVAECAASELRPEQPTEAELGGRHCGWLLRALDLAGKRASDTLCDMVSEDCATMWKAVENSRAPLWAEQVKDYFLTLVGRHGEGKWLQRMPEDGEQVLLPRAWVWLSPRLSPTGLRQQLVKRSLDHAAMAKLHSYMYLRPDVTLPAEASWPSCLRPPVCAISDVSIVLREALEMQKLALRQAKGSFGISGITDERLLMQAVRAQYDEACMACIGAGHIPQPPILAAESLWYLSLLALHSHRAYDTLTTVLKDLSGKFTHQAGVRHFRSTWTEMQDTLRVIDGLIGADGCTAIQDELRSGLMYIPNLLSATFCAAPDVLKDAFDTLSRLSWGPSGLTIVRVQNEYHECVNPCTPAREIRLHLAARVPLNEAVYHLITTRGGLPAKHGETNDIQFCLLMELVLITPVMKTSGDSQRLVSECEQGTFKIFNTVPNKFDLENAKQAREVKLMRNAAAQQDLPSLRRFIRYGGLPKTDMYRAAAVHALGIELGEYVNDGSAQANPMVTCFSIQADMEDLVDASVEACLPTDAELDLTRHLEECQQQGAESNIALAELREQFVAEEHAAGELVETTAILEETRAMLEAAKMTHDDASAELQVLRETCLSSEHAAEQAKQMHKEVAGNCEAADAEKQRLREDLNLRSEAESKLRQELDSAAATIARLEQDLVLSVEAEKKALDEASELRLKFEAMQKMHGETNVELANSRAQILEMQITVNEVEALRAKRVEVEDMSKDVSEELRVAREQAQKQVQQFALAEQMAQTFAESEASAAQLALAAQEQALAESKGFKSEQEYAAGRERDALEAERLATEKALKVAEDWKKLQAQEMKAQSLAHELRVELDYFCEEHEEIQRAFDGETQKLRAELEARHQHAQQTMKEKQELEVKKLALQRERSELQHELEAQHEDVQKRNREASALLQELEGLSKDFHRAEQNVVDAERQMEDLRNCIRALEADMSTAEVDHEACKTSLEADVAKFKAELSRVSLEAAGLRTELQESAEARSKEKEQHNKENEQHQAKEKDLTSRLTDFEGQLQNAEQQLEATGGNLKRTESELTVSRADSSYLTLENQRLAEELGVAQEITRHLEGSGIVASIRRSVSTKARVKERDRLEKSSRDNVRKMSMTGSGSSNQSTPREGAGAAPRRSSPTASSPMEPLPEAPEDNRLVP